MKQRQRLRMQGHDVNMCKNVIKKISRDSHSPQRTTTKMKTCRKTSHLPSRCYKEEFKKSSIKMYEAREDLLTRELKQAQRQHDFSNVHRLSRRRSGKNIGPKRRVFGRAHAKRLGVEKWETAMEKTGQEGGQQALKIDFEEQRKNLWEEHSALGLLPATEELIKQADEDLEAFRAKVKKTKKEDVQCHKAQRQ